MLKNIDLSLKPYFTGKIIHVIISILITAGFTMPEIIPFLTLLALTVTVSGKIIFYLFEKSSKNRN